MTRAWIAALLLPLAACGGGDASEDVEALEEAAQKQADRFAAGDYAGSWEMWTDEAKATVSQDVYVAYSEECAGGGVPLEVADARIDEPGEATVRIALGDFAQSYSMAYEDGEWRWVPTEATLENLGDATVEDLPECG